VEAFYRNAETGFADDAPAIRAVDDIFASAVAARATDVHIEPTGNGGRVRERVDGCLREARSLSSDLFERVLSRIKLLAAMDIADRRIPQDGRYAVGGNDGAIEARVSSMPTVAGEKLAVRLLYAQQRIPALEELGMPAAMAARYREIVAAPCGFVVVCGPTGSGKTTSLYASLAQRDCNREHLCTIEDPVEVRLPGITQVQVNARAGLTFAGALRSLLRQDPDAILIGETRDAETAGVAASAALSGQLVLTTLHTSDAMSAPDRLIELGVSPRTLAASVTAIVSQRLVRQLCAYCKNGARPVGCERCDGSGYWGRSAVFEMAVMSPDLRKAIETMAPIGERLEAACRTGYVPLAAGAARLVKSGESSTEELRRLFPAVMPR
jgi:type II secretory ATPase GspE/PulE/Tfp pilus assembly ATPase PilB-like protein